MKIKFKLEEYILLIVIIVFAFLQFGLMNELVQVPSPLYGGDYYHSLGAIQHVLSGGNPFLSSNTLGAEPGYLPLYTLLVGGLGLIFGLSAFTAMKVFSMLIMIASLVLFYVFAKKLFSRSAALISTLLYLPLMLFPILKYRQFTAAFILPLFFLAALNFYRDRDYKSAVLLGIATGVIAISHSAAFLAAIFFLLVLAVHMFVFEHFYKKKFRVDTFKLELRKNLLQYMIIAVLGIGLSLIYWYQPIFLHHLNMPAASLYNLDFSSVSLHIGFVLGTLKEYFLNFSTVFHSIRSSLFILGVVILPFIKNYTKERRFILLILISTFIASFHHLITEPLFGTSFSPIIIASFIFVFTACIMAGLLISILEEALKGKWRLVMIAIVGLIMLFSIINYTNYIKDDVWMNRGKEPLEDIHVAMQTWVLDNTDVNDVFISSNELNFGLNSLTGRKVLNTRRAQNSPFLDTESRQLDTAIILYGNNTEKRKELIDFYSVDYLYWDAFWLESEYRFDAEAQRLVGWFDPLVIHDTAENRQVLASSNILHFAEHTWLDPTVHEPLPKEDLLFILPTRMIYTNPWNPDLENYLVEVWNYSIEGNVVSRIYEVKK